MSLADSFDTGQANYFKGDANTAINESDEAFQQRVNGAPTPSDR